MSPTTGTRIALIALGLLFAAVPARAGAKLTVTPASPTVGRIATIQITGAAVDLDPATCALVPTYRPNSATKTVGETIAFDETGGAAFTPIKPGIVALVVSCGEEKIVAKNVAVKFAGVPRSGLAVMLVAGIVLLGGTSLAFYRVRFPG